MKIRGLLLQDRVVLTKQVCCHLQQLLNSNRYFGHQQLLSSSSYVSNVPSTIQDPGMKSCRHSVVQVSKNLSNVG